MESNIIFEEIVKPTTYYEGTYHYSETRRDKFGTLRPGEVRSFLINTKYGQLHLPQCYGNKKIRISLEVINGS